MTQHRFGAHFSIVGSIDKPIQQGEELDCSALQIFFNRVNQWQANPIAAELAESFRSAHRIGSIGSDGNGHRRDLEVLRSLGAGPSLIDPEIH